jgi:hypothetical protein
MTPQEAELRKAIKCLSIEVDESICAEIDKKVSAALAAEREKLEARLKKAAWALRKVKGKEMLAYEFACQTLDDIEEPPKCGKETRE